MLVHNLFTWLDRGHWASHWTGHRQCHQCLQSVHTIQRRRSNWYGKITDNKTNKRFLLVREKVLFWKIKTEITSLAMRNQHLLFIYLCMILVTQVHNFHLNVIKLYEEKSFFFFLKMIMFLLILVIPRVMLLVICFHIYYLK